MLIDVMDTNTIPLDVKQKIKSDFLSLLEKNRKSLVEKTVKNINDVTIAIEEYVRPAHNFDLYKELIEILDQHELVCFILC